MSPEGSFQSRHIRVFISSTFRDMQAERDYLVKFVFPELRKMCESRGVIWGEVDLRWGVTDEQKAEGKVLPICLDEIRRCQPYFIGLLGERYGWIPDSIPSEIMEREPWLGDHLGGRTSVTELEILHGVLRNAAMRGHAFFYFHDPRHIKEAAPGAEGFLTEPAGNMEKLARLKARIRRASGDDLCRLRENYGAPQELGRWVREDFAALINRLFPDAPLDPLDRDAADHAAFAASRANVYIGRPSYFDCLDAHAEGHGPPLVVLGDAGSGKSALLANWEARYRAAHPERMLLMHFIGATPYSADWMAMLRRIMGEFKRRYGLPEEIPEQPEALRAAFPDWLAAAAGRERIVLVLDALNQLEDRDGALDLVWLPSRIPSNIRLVVSTLPGRPLDEAKRRAWPTLEVLPLILSERVQFIVEHLAQYRKSLDPQRVARLADATQTANPLFLRALLEELRLFGVHELLDQRIGRYLAAQGLPALFELILERYEQDYESDRPGLVRDAMRCLWAARRGLSEAEIMALLGADGQPLPGAVWSPLYLAAELSMVNRSGLIGFFHDYLRQAVQARYLATESDQTEAHMRLARFYLQELHRNMREAQEAWQATQTRRHPWSRRILDELPWQLARAKAWTLLAQFLSDPQTTWAVMSAAPLDALRYWAEIESASPLRAVGAYRDVIERPSQHEVGLAAVGEVLKGLGHNREALVLLDYLDQRARNAPKGTADLLQAYSENRAEILAQMGRLDEALEVFTIGEADCRATNDQRRLAVMLCGQGNILRLKDRLDEAFAKYQEQEQVCRAIGDRQGLWACLNNQGIVQRARGHAEAAMALFVEQERLCRESGYDDGLAKSLAGRANVLQDEGRGDEALDLMRQHMDICRQLGDKDGMAASLGNQGRILRERGELDAALRVLEEAERISREIDAPLRVASCLVTKGNVLASLQQFDEAIRAAEEALSIAVERGYKDLADNLPSNIDSFKAWRWAKHQASKPWWES